MVAKKTPAKKTVKAPAKKIPAKKTPAKKTPAVAEEQRKSPQKRRPRSAFGAEKLAKQKSDYGNDGGDTEERDESVGAHAAFVVSHFGGGAEATAEILGQAIEVWQRLPGAVVRGPAQVRPNRPAAPASGYDQNQDPEL